MTTYSTDSYGKFIPASQRPDGTWRKARRVRNGYVPQEEVPLYESKGKQFAQRKSMLPLGLYPVTVSKKTPKQQQTSANSNKVKNDPIQKSQSQQIPGVLKLPPGTNTTAKPMTPSTTTKTKKKSSSSATTAKSGKSPKTIDEANTIENSMNALSEQISTQLQINNGIDDISKKLRRLRKKLREIEQLEEKIRTVILKKPDKDQLEKLKRKQQLCNDLAALEAALSIEFAQQ